MSHSRHALATQVRNACSTQSTLARAVAAACIAWGCSSNNEPGANGSGGAQATGNGGTVASGGSAQGGTKNSGGAVSTGGVTSGGATSSGGASANGGTTSGTATTGGKTGSAGAGALGGATSSGGSSSAAGGVTASGGATANGGNGSSGSSGGPVPLVYDTEDTGSACPKPTSFPAFSALTPVANLPDPFLMSSGTRIASRDDWKCRRAEIAAQIQYWGSGPKGAPPSNLTATFSGGKLTVTVTQGGATITLSSTISTPSGAGPFPLIIGMNTGTGSLPSDIFTGHGVATMAFNSSQLVPDGFNVPRGGGTYFTMYPDKNAGAMIEWAWGVSRLIDGLYKTADQNKIDLKHIGVTGCSYQGKMALYAGAFDERIALTIPEESGGGGEASWRVMATQTGTEDLEAAQGTAWYAQNLLQFKNKDAPKLPYDQHELVAMIAPRAVLTIANTGIDRLGSEAGYVSMKAATEVYKALGIPERIGFTQTAAASHCAFPSSQTADVQAFVDKFLLGKSTDTGIAKSPYKTDLSKWITWATPTLN